MLKLERILVTLALATIAGVGCSKNGSSPSSQVAHAEQNAPGTPEPSEPMAAQEPEQGEKQLNGGQIVQILDTLNEGEIEQARVAQAKAQTADVKAFAEHMIAQHAEAKQKGAALAKKIQLD